MLERADRQPSGSSPSAAGHRFGTLRLRELLAARGEAGLWLAQDEGSGRTTLLRLYPGLPKLEEWHTLELAASQVAYAVDARLVAIEEIALDIWPRLTFSCPDAESLAQRIARAPMAPEAAVALCADVAGALAALARAGVPPVDVSPADVVLAGERARLLADVGLPGGKVAHVCVDLDHVAPERAAAIAERAQGVRGARPGGAPTAASMTYALASIVAAALHGPRAGGESPAPPPLEQALRRGLAESPAERHRSPGELVLALGDAIGVDPRGAARARRVPRPRRTAPVPVPVPTTAMARPQRRARPGRRSAGVALATAAVLVAAGVGIAVGSASTPADPPAATKLAGAGLSIEAPPGWVRGEAGSSPIGDAVLVAHPAGRSGATELAITRAAAPLLTRLADAVPAPVRLGDYGAWRYRDVAVDGGSVADVYVLEDGDGPIVAACLSPAGSPASPRVSCAAALTTLRLAGATVALGGDAATRTRLARIVTDLDRTRTNERRALAVAATGRRQAAAADRLAAAYARAAAGAGANGTVGAPGALPRLADALQRAGRAYAALATAARGEHRAAYAQAREQVVACERTLAAALAALGSASASG